MRLATFLPPGESRPRAGEVRDDRVVAFADETVTVLDLLSGKRDGPEADGPEAEGPEAEGPEAEGPDAEGPHAEGPDFALAEVTLLAPVPQPRAIFGIGMNYSDHIAEIGASAPESPVVFMKLPYSAAPPGAPVRCPAAVNASITRASWRS